MEVVMAPRSTCSYSYGLVLGSPVRNKELGLMILTGPFQMGDLPWFYEKLSPTHYFKGAERNFKILLSD